MGFERSQKDTEEGIPEKIVEGLLWSFNMYFNISVHNVQNLTAHLESTQLTLDAMFNLVMRLGHENNLTLEILLQVDSLVDNLVNSVKKEHYGPALYYKFKQQQFISIHFELIDDSISALKYYKKTMEVEGNIHIIFKDRFTVDINYFKK